MMKPQRLWPVMMALLLILGGAMAMEAAARQRGTTTEIIQIHDTASADEADEEVNEAEWARTDAVDDDHARVRTLARRRDFAGAAELMASVVSAHPGKGELLAEYGHLLRRAGELDEAQQVLERARELLPASASVDLDEGMIFRRRGESDRALACFRRAAESRPDHTATLLAYGALLRDEGRLDQAIAVLKPATEKGSNDERARGFAELGSTLVAAGRVDDARRAFERAIERAPAMASVWLSGARAFGECKRPEDQALALQYALTATKLAPGIATAHGVLGRTLEYLGRSDEAVDAYQRAVSVDESYAYAFERLVRIHVDRQDYRAARAAAAALLRIAPSKREFVFVAGSVESAAGDYEAARERFRAAVDASESPYPEALYNLGIVERRLGNLDESIAAYITALQQRPDYRAAWNNLGLTYAEAGRYEEAEASLRHAIELDPRYGSAWSNLARMYSNLKRYADAVEAYRKLTELRPNDQGARMKLAIALRRAGHADESIAQYERLVREQPRYVAAWYNLGIAYNAANRPKDAKRAYRRALDVDPNHVKSMKNLGLLLARLGELEAAEAQLSSALNYDAGDTGIRQRLAEVLRDRGALQRCADEAGRVLAQDSTNTEAEQLWNQCQHSNEGATP